jgi:hypothetical protein
MRQSLPFPWNPAIGIGDFIHSTEAKYFYEDVVWESVDRRSGSIQRLPSQLVYHWQYDYMAKRTNASVPE